jgi:hypothetical protein
MIHQIQMNEKTSICNESRKLLAAGASENDRIELFRGETLCVSGNVGKLAKLTLVENKDGLPTFRYAKWTPFPTLT